MGNVNSGMLFVLMLKNSFGKVGQEQLVPCKPHSRPLHSAGGEWIEEPAHTGMLSRKLLADGTPSRPSLLGLAEVGYDLTQQVKV